MAGFTFADVFAGIGGFRKAFESLGGTCVLSIEQDKYCKITQEANYVNAPGHVWHYDIRTVPEDIVSEKVDLVCGGFPCQPFSLAGKRKGTDDPRGTLFWNLAELIRELSPKVILLENVPNLASINDGRTLRDMLLHLEIIGYDCFN